MTRQKKQGKVTLIECIPKSDGQDARLLSEFFKMIDFDHDVVQCSEKRTLITSLDAPSRYFHISAHGDGEMLYVMDDPVRANDFECKLRGQLVTLSSCAIVSADFVMSLHRSTDVSAVISPLASVDIGESAIFATLFYFALAQSPKLSSISRRGERDETKLTARLAQYIDAFQKAKHAYIHAGGTGSHRLFYWLGDESCIVT